ncbi:phosphopantetheine adenylyltransferase [Gordonia hirsuta DSM 44140 = NBRC 16056]|uniref:Phosphopantetheine adenylyltransferase n=1 Tax=Gordonia hirsuta DSM 44140 = NBRC 16056 TaxID=1121927 RepID=L7LD37_9ACTN|nr:pantetheine-phosphate adenylyltransferase [Gordonia hirsuta]GAC58834.1 phosphopantetheine adenylyltransferase [Gordonia hirsuta DSM 44140 = NBRC 16056]
MSAAVIPGSYDPFTLGHRFVVTQAATRFERVIVAVVVNPNKRGMFTVAERIAMIEADCADLPNVTVRSWTGLLVDLVREEDATTIVKGLRSETDFAYEAPMAQMNRELSGAETFFMLTDPRFAHVSSSLIKEVARLGGDTAPYLSPAIHQALDNRVDRVRAV